jgi:hypothetical protein
VVASWVMTAVLAQAVPGSTSPAPDLDKIRKALNEAQAIILVPPTRAEGPVFRVTVRGSKLETRPWDGWSAAPTYVRPWFRGDHHEFLEQVTPEEFRSATLYPIGQITTGMIESLVKLIKAANRKMGEAAARREVQQALEEFRACQANRDRPGC